MKNGEGSENN
jgi:hypothetical protein